MMGRTRPKCHTCQPIDRIPFFMSFLIVADRSSHVSHKKHIYRFSLRSSIINQTKPQSLLLFTLNIKHNGRKIVISSVFFCGIEELRTVFMFHKKRLDIIGLLLRDGFYGLVFWWHVLPRDQVCVGDATLGRKFNYLVINVITIS